MPLDSDSPAIPAIDQHNAEIHENLQHWKRKPELQAEYAGFYRLIAAELPPPEHGPVLECGSGIGNLKSVLPAAVTSDLFPNPWLDRQENVYALSYADRSLAGIVLFDVFHHLRYPGTVLSELHRVLQPGGRVVMMEPSAGLLGRIALGLFHHEPLALRDAITWSAPADFAPDAIDYYAAQGNAWRVFGAQRDQFPLAGWELVKVIYLPAFPWIMTGGFRGPNLNRGWLRPLNRAVDRVLRLAPRCFASRMVVVLEKSSE
ncbi:class I SAM-dependent methyltransferase [Synoicihabitans lomoniglobus]|uniref:Methyltransferase domain-containing protein n=1 Tax=Synoicihabitans lomoniglobus TaxID=2909285 RepID=A0AAE9ZX26_9BACT|nr:class I SAM-dependent methyltransferase [Opitutaceae bacterium LMO-M01]WED65742.1 methyltransferase domain-containing protein [Opitutaceae bacterium LMO-M01]